MKHYENDPREIKVRFPGTCATCGARLTKGANAYYFPATRKLYCLSCGDSSYRSFLQSAADEEWYSRQYRY